MPFFRNLLHKISGRHILTDDDRKAAEEVRATKLAIKKEQLEREAEIQKLRDLKVIEKLTSNSDSDFQTLMALFAGAMQNPSPSNPAHVVSQVAPAIHLSDEDIEQAISQLPKAVLKVAKGMTPDAIKQFVVQRIGQVDDDSIGRIVNRIKK
jgi:hypothetical protein